MMSELTRELNEFDVELCTVLESERSKADQDIIELTGFVLQLSRKFDGREDPIEALNWSRRNLRQTAAARRGRHPYAHAIKIEALRPHQALGLWPPARYGRVIEVGASVGL